MQDLGKQNLMRKLVFTYIDDLCWLTWGATISLDPTQPILFDYPFWNYPLDIIAIKDKASQCSQGLLKHDALGHFMNVLIHVYEEQYIMWKVNKRQDLPFAYS